MHASYASLGKDFKGTFDTLVRELNEQKSGAEKLRQQIVEANNELAVKNTASTIRLTTLLEEERETQAAERQVLLTQITSLINSTAQKREKRIESGIASIRTEFDEHSVAHGKAHEDYVAGERLWAEQSDEIVNNVIRSRDNVKSKLKADFAVSASRKQT